MEPTPPAQSLTGPVHDLILRVDSAIASEPEFESSRGVEAAANSFSLLPYLVMDHPIQCRDRAGARSNLSFARPREYGSVLANFIDAGRQTRARAWPPRTWPG